MSVSRPPAASAVPATASGSEARVGYAPPVILWEEAFVALAVASPLCDSSYDPNCQSLGPGRSPFD